jgi:uncharacterized repeat protein (TIGR01451 family)
MANRKTNLSLSVTVVLALMLALPWAGPSAESPLPPRENPDFRDLLSGVVVFDPSQEEMAGGQPMTRDPLYLAASSVPRGPNVVCNQDLGTGHQNEPSIAVNPDDPKHVIASSNDYRGPGDVHPGYYVSFDGGLTWPGDGIIDLSPIPLAEAGGDPALAIHDLNNVYFAYIAFSRTADDVGGVYVSKSTDGGMSWNAPVELAANTLTVFHDKEYVTVDATGSPYDGHVYVSWTRFSGSAPIYFSRSTDGGASYSTPMQISDLSSNQGSIPAVGPNGNVYVVWYNYNTSAQRMAVSTNGGGSFGTPFHVSGVSPIPSPLPGGSFRVNSFPTMAIDQNNGNLYVAWNDYRNGDADILFVRSTDGGGTWSSPIRVNDDALGNARHQFFPWLSVAPNGNIYAGWFDSRLDPTPYTQPFYYDEYVAVSTDGGLTFSPNARISSVTSDASIGFSGQFIGDYSGIAATDTFVYPAWVDTRRGHQDIFTQADLQIGVTKTAPPAVDPGQSFTYTLVLSSTGTWDDNFLTDPLPPEVAYIPGSLWASSGDYGESGGVVTWTGTLDAAQPVTLTFQVTPTAGACTAITNTASFTDGSGTLLHQALAYTHISGTVPAAGFEPSEWAPKVGQIVTFTNESTGTMPLQFLWDFGDGTTSTSPSPSHSYGLPGPYTVVLTASNACGLDTHTESLTVTCDPPTAAFSWAAAGLLVTFTNESTGTFPLEFEWDMGDGVTSTLPAPTHTYGSPGVYTVRLTATDLCGSGVHSDLLRVGDQGYLIYLPLVIKE